MSEIERPSPTSARLNAVYEHEPSRLLGAATQAVSSFPNWSLRGREDNVLRAVRTTRLLRFKDDITLKAKPVSADRTRLELHSASRLGLTDFGQNPRNLRELMGALDRELS